jgi:hypothetical protein
MIDSIPGHQRWRGFRLLNSSIVQAGSYAIQPSAHLGIFEKSRSYHARSYIHSAFVLYQIGSVSHRLRSRSKGRALYRQALGLVFDIDDEKGARFFRSSLGIR